MQLMKSLIRFRPVHFGVLHPSRVPHDNRLSPNVVQLQSQRPNAGGGALPERRSRSTHEGRPTSMRAPYFVEDESWAKQIVDIVQEASKPSVVFLANPGSSVLSKLFLNSDVTDVVAFEPNTNFSSFFESLSMDHPEKCTHHAKNILSINQFFRPPNAQLLRLPVESTSACVIGNISGLRSYIPMLSLSLTEKTTVWNYGSLDHYLLVDEKELNIITNAAVVWKTKKYLRTFLYSLLFTAQSILSIPMTALVRSGPTGCRRLTNETNFMHLVQLRLRDDLFTGLIGSREEIARIIRIIRLIMPNKSRRIIPMLERWCPDIGLPLIELGVTMMNRAVDVPFDLWPQICRTLTSHPNYEVSALKCVIENVKNVTGARSSKLISMLRSDLDTEPGDPLR